MIKQRKIQTFLALSVTILFFFQSCATFISGTSQKIPLTSNPIGARIRVDGKETGYTPLNLKLKKNKNYVIRIEKEGYNYLEIRITKKVSTPAIIISLLGGAISGACLGAFIGYVSKYYSDYSILSIFTFPLFLVKLLEGEIEKEEVNTWPILLGILAGSGLDVLSGSLSGKIFNLSPKELEVTLSRIEEKSQFDVIQIDSAQFQNVKWIKINFADSDIIDEFISLDRIID